MAHFTALTSIEGAQRKPTSAPIDMQTAEWLETNSRWLEALDPGSGRVYFVDLETQQSSWDPPTHFMDRKELSTALQKADADLKSKPAGDDEATFLEAWRKGEPVIVEGVGSKLRRRWTPDAFSALHGSR